MPIKARTLRDLSHRIWEHVCNMEVESPDDIKTGAPLIPVLNKELQSFMAGIVDHCALMVAKAEERGADGADWLAHYAANIRKEQARKVEIPQPDEHGIESIEPETVAKLVGASRNRRPCDQEGWHRDPDSFDGKMCEACAPTGPVAKGPQP